jgi:hypothetical protein
MKFGSLGGRITRFSSQKEIENVKIENKMEVPTKA